MKALVPAPKRRPARLRYERLEARVTPELKDLLLDAATMRGVTLSDFLINSAHDAAVRTVEQHRIIRLSREASLQFADAAASAEAQRAAPGGGAASPLGHRPPVKGKRSVSPNLRADYLVEALADRHDRSRFCCGVEALDQYFRTQAGQDARRRVASPYVLVRRTEDPIAGYYTLSNAGLDLGDLPESLARRLPRYRQIPATLLGRLAVDRNHRGRGLGEFLLVDALRRARLGSETTAAFAVVVEAKDDSSARFY